MSTGASSAGKASKNRLVIAIGVFKLVKTALLIAFAVVAFRLAGLVSEPRDPLHTVIEAIAWLGTFPGRRVLVRWLQRLWDIDSKEAATLGLVSLGYATVFLVEGLGLLSRKRWAEWLTVGVTASFVPFEIYELVERFGMGKVIAIGLNVTIVVYLVWHRLGGRRRRGDRRTAMNASADSAADSDPSDSREAEALAHPHPPPAPDV